MCILFKRTVYINNIEKKRGNVSDDVYYQEQYLEMRRHRDIELQTEIWLTSLNTIVLGAIFASKSSENDFLSAMSSNQKLILVFLFGLIILFGCITIRYSARRYDELRLWFDNQEYFEPYPKPYLSHPWFKPYMGYYVINVIIFIGSILLVYLKT